MAMVDVFFLEDLGSKQVKWYWFSEAVEWFYFWFLKTKAHWGWTCCDILLYRLFNYIWISFYRSTFVKTILLISIEFISLIQYLFRHSWNYRVAICYSFKLNRWRKRSTAMLILASALWPLPAIVSCLFL